MIKKYIIHKKVIVFLTILVTMSLLVSLWIYSHKPVNLSVEKELSDEYLDNLPVYRTSVSTVVNTDNLDEVVGDADYVFIAKVVSQDEYVYKYPVQIETEDGGYREVSDPYTNYRVRILQNIKGELISDQDIPLQKKGGLYQDGSGYAMYEDDELPVAGNIYAFFAYVQKDDTLLVAGPKSNKKIDIPRSTRASNVKDTIETSEEVADLEEAYKSQVIRKGRREFGVSIYDKKSNSN